MSISYRTGTDLQVSDLVDLYDAVGWSLYTRAPETLQAGIRASLRVITAWDGERLVGLARIVGDGLTIVYLQDILVHPTYQRRAIGRELLQRAFEPFAGVRQQVLMTDAEPGQRAFYEAMGFREIRDLEPSPRVFVRFNQG